MLVYNSTHVANVAMSAIKIFMTENQRQAVRMGCQICDPDESRNADRRLKDFYLQPDRMEAERRLLERARLLLQIRIENERNFRL